MPEGVRIDPRRAGEDRPVQPETPALREATATPSSRSATVAPGPLMTLTRFKDRWLYYSNTVWQQEAVGLLYNEIMALEGGRALLSEDAAWALRYSETPEEPPAPPQPEFSNPLVVKWQSQLDNSSGTGYRECFSSSCGMIAMYHGKVSSDDEYNRIRAKYGDSTNPNAQIAALESLGLHPTYIQNGRSSDLKKEIDEGRPVGVGWLHNGHVSNPSGGGHWTVVSGYGSDYWVHEDPNGEADLVNGGYTPITNGAQRKYSVKNWNPRWLLNGEGDGWAMLVRP